MARTNNLSNFLTDVADSIRSKKGTTGRISASNFDTEIAGIQTGVDINGIIEQYKVFSGGNVNAGDFVSFVNELYANDPCNIGEDTELSNVVFSGQTISAVKINENKIFIAHSYNTGSCLYGIVCNVNGTNITIGTDTLINNANDSGYSLSVEKLNDNKIFIVGRNQFGNLIGTLCSVTDLNITVITSAILDTNVYTSFSKKTITTTILADNEILVAYAKDASNHYLHSLVCTIDDLSITNGTVTQLSSVEKTGDSISLVKLNENKVLIVHNYSSDNYLYGMICEINAKQIIAGTDTMLINVFNNGYTISAVKLTENKVFIAHTGASLNLMGILCNIDQVISIDTDTKLNTSSQTGSNMSIVKLCKDKVYIGHRSDNSTKYLCRTICNTIGNVISVESYDILSTLTPSGEVISVSELNENSVIIFHSNKSSNISRCLYGMVEVLNNGTRCKTIKEDNEMINGIAKTNGTAGQNVQIYVPNI